MTGPSIVSTVYRISRLELAYGFSKMYLWTFWWALIGLPIGGTWFVLGLPSPVMRYIGTVMILWPITIPGRAVLLSFKSYQQLGRPMRAIVAEDALYLEPEAGKGIRVGFDWIRRIRRSGDLYLFSSKRLQLMAIKVSAFDLPQQAELEARFKSLKLS